MLLQRPNNNNSKEEDRVRDMSRESPEPEVNVEDEDEEETADTKGTEGITEDESSHDNDHDTETGLTREASPPRGVNSFLKFSIQSILQRAVTNEALVNQHKRVAAALADHEAEEGEAKTKAKFDPSSLSIW